jgi:hypothetical protein
VYFGWEFRLMEWEGRIASSNKVMLSLRSCCVSAAFGAVLPYLILVEGIPKGEFVDYPSFRLIHAC